MYTQVPRAVLWLLKGDEFQMGGAGGDTAPAHTVELESFYISRGPISNIQYEAFAPDFCRHPQSTEDDAPAAGLSFHQATAYAQWYADLAGKNFDCPRRPSGSSLPEPWATPAIHGETTPLMANRMHGLPRTAASAAILSRPHGRARRVCTG
jgi:hypothetical protein